MSGFQGLGPGCVLWFTVKACVLWGFLQTSVASGSMYWWTTFGGSREIFYCFGKRSIFLAPKKNRQRTWEISIKVGGIEHFYFKRDCRALSFSVRQGKASWNMLFTAQTGTVKAALLQHCVDFGALFSPQLTHFAQPKDHCALIQYNKHHTYFIPVLLYNISKGCVKILGYMRILLCNKNKKQPRCSPVPDVQTLWWFCFGNTHRHPEIPASYLGVFRRHSAPAILSKTAKLSSTGVIISSVGGWER